MIKTSISYIDGPLFQAFELGIELDVFTEPYTQRG